jgi:endoglucanase
VTHGRPAQPRRQWLVALAVVVLGCGGSAGPRPPEPVAAVPAARLARLSHGVNVTRWFNEWGRKPSFAHHLSDADLGAIRALGFRVVRLAVDPQYLHRPGEPGLLDPVVLADLDSAIDRLLTHDLAVIVTPFSHDRFLLEDSAQAAGFVRFWEALAGNLGTRDPERVFLEVVNEPVFSRRADAWDETQRVLLAAMRRGAPRHTLIATGPFWSAIDGLVRVSPVRDPNIVYTFHFYDPHAFTHQGLSWAPTAKLHGLPYPADSSRCAAAVGRLTDSGPVVEAKRYCAGHWDRAMLGAALDRADQWGQAHRVPVFAGEFGVACTAPKKDRLAWMRDTRVELERRGIGWALWGWDDDCFGLNAHRTADGRLVLDAGVLNALGLDGERPLQRAAPM